MIVACFLPFVGCLVSEVVRFIDNDKIVVSPIDVRKINIAGEPAVTGKIGMVQYIIVEAVGGKKIPAVIGFIERPVVTQPLRAKDQHPVVS